MRFYLEEHLLIAEVDTNGNDCIINLNPKPKVGAVKMYLSKVLKSIVFPLSSPYNLIFSNHFYTLPNPLSIYGNNVSA